MLLSVQFFPGLGRRRDEGREKNILMVGARRSHTFRQDDRTQTHRAQPPGEPRAAAPQPQSCGKGQQDLQWQQGAARFPTGSNTPVSIPSVFKSPLSWPSNHCYATALLQRQNSHGCISCSPLWPCQSCLGHRAQTTRAPPSAGSI